ncbi:hypothetical protein [Aeromonas veronii]|uniref:hypothetical protein n=1 Tax=Aeromonas veronii TaxID=654 RepID=UPI0032EFA4F9
MIQRGKLDIEIYRGDSQVLEFYYLNIDNQTGVESIYDLSTVNVKAQVRYNADSDIWLDLAPQIVDASKGLIRIVITSNMSANAAPPSQPNAPVQGVWDMQFVDKTNSSIVFTTVMGSFNVHRDITR